ncbi:hypothetical protein GGP41_003652 [Bipolaris sorokiniana]|uniref:Uncharacterized protein n=1 Tax=Cochliobolus sativus TaxID=45130 RepID=A0A8H5ZBQ8_COCSA|nr:hypothetical protein GGP41_003652 [Bipolaris sorokiniana]
MSPYVKPNIKEYPPGEPIWYDLIANTTRKVFQKKDNSVKGEGWYDVQNLFVEKERGETLFTK